MPTPSRAAAILVGLLLLVGTTGRAWVLESGQKIRAKAVSFDYEEKAVGFEDAVTGKVTEVASEDLSLRSRQRLLISDIFLESYPDDDGWPDEKYYLLRLAVLSPSVALLIGFWIGGVLITKKVNPIRALIGFLGSWMIGCLFVFFYLFFAGRFGGGLGTVLVGVVLGAVFLAFFVSVIYSCSVSKAFLVFLFQIFAAGFLIIVGLALSVALVPPDKLETFWNERVFIPSGLLPPSPSPFQTAAPSTEGSRPLPDLLPREPSPRTPCLPRRRDLA